ncbi:hypothetical protein B0A49_10781 [Cryomyces minteri]|uniref:Uncharacterized protein n=1 Tax=Cryomyces minteri TaxID=331657 RepID=A0A4U0WLE7_9PEZI|nr:hypothetical protein B0A49_10781 [Cryomyces minteri]
MAAFFALDAKRWTSDAPRGNSRECCQQNNIGIEMVDNAHTQPAEPGLFIKIVRYMGYEEAVRIKEQTEIYAQHPTANDELEFSSLEMREHLTRANRAVARLKERATHLEWYSKAQSYFIDGCNEIFVRTSQAVVFENTYMVPVRSNLLIEGNLYVGTEDGSPRSQLYGTQCRGLITLSALYGGAHLLAWHSHFPSVIERWLWRASGISMAATPLSLALVVLFMNVEDRMWARHIQGKVRLRSLRRLCGGIVQCGAFANFMLFATVLTLAYPFSRGFVLVEAFASLRSPPVGTYSTTSWTGFIPHLG